jgi:hypothetical protein
MRGRRRRRRRRRWRRWCRRGWRSRRRWRWRGYRGWRWLRPSGLDGPGDPELPSLHAARATPSRTRPAVHAPTGEPDGERRLLARFHEGAATTGDREGPGPLAAVRDPKLRRPGPRRARHLAGPVGHRHSHTCRPRRPGGVGHARAGDNAERDRREGRRRDPQHYTAFIGTELERKTPVRGTFLLVLSRISSVRAAWSLAPPRTPGVGERLRSSASRSSW